MRLNEAEYEVIAVVLEWCKKPDESSYVGLVCSSVDGEIRFVDETVCADMSTLIVASQADLEQWLKEEWAAGRKYHYDWRRKKYDISSGIYVQPVTTEERILRELEDEADE